MTSRSTSMTSPAAGSCAGSSDRPRASPAAGRRSWRSSPERERARRRLPDAVQRERHGLDLQHPDVGQRVRRHDVPAATRSRQWHSAPTARAWRSARRTGPQECGRSSRVEELARTTVRRRRSRRWPSSHGGNCVLTASNDGVAACVASARRRADRLPLSRRYRRSGRSAPGCSQSVEDHDRQTFVGDLRSRQRPPDGDLADRPVPDLGLALSDDGRYSVTFAAPNRAPASPVRAPVRIWSVAAHGSSGRLAPTAVYQAALEPRRFAARPSGGVPHSGVGRSEVLTLATGRIVKLHDGRRPAATLREDVPAFSGDDTRIAAPSFCGFADVWNTDTGPFDASGQPGW